MVLLCMCRVHLYCTVPPLCHFALVAHLHLLRSSPVSCVSVPLCICLGHIYCTAHQLVVQSFLRACVQPTFIAQFSSCVTLHALPGFLGTHGQSAFTMQVIIS